MVRLFLTLVFVALFGCNELTKPAPAAPPISVVDPTTRALDSTIVLLAKQREAEWDGLVCAGVWIGPHRILTAYHCVIPAAFHELDQKAAEMGFDPPLNPVDQEVRFVNHTNWVEHETDDGSISERYQISAQVLAVDEMNDVALLHTTANAPVYVTVSASLVTVGLPVFTVGHPSGLAYSYSKGYVSNPVRTLSEKERLYTQVNISVWHGNSGGGLFDARGDLVGICSAMFVKNPTISFFVSLGPIHKLVATAKIEF